MEERIVVSDIGEQWSPYTEPASVAPRVGIRYAPAPSALQIIVTIGISIPKVPQEVPMEKLMRAAMTKIMNGRRARGRLELLTKPDIK